MSLFLGCLFLVLSSICAAAVWVFGHRAGESPRKVRALTWAFAVAGPVLGWSVGSIDAEQRRVTLHEVVLGCAPDHLGRTALEIEVEVLHPGIEHCLVLAPMPAVTGTARGPCGILARWTNPNGAVILEKRESLLTGPTSRRAIRSTWDSASWRFTPNAPGLHRLSVELDHPDAAHLFVRVEDPLGPGRPRAPGY